MSPKSADSQPSTNKPSESDRSTGKRKDGIGWTMRKKKKKQNIDGVCSTNISSIPSTQADDHYPMNAMALPPGGNTPVKPVPVAQQPTAPVQSTTPPQQTSPVSPRSPPPPSPEPTVLQPRRLQPQRIPSVMYCPVLDKSGMGYGNEARRVADLL